MKSYIYILVISFICLSVSSNAQVTQNTLNEYLITAANQNPDLKARFSSYMAAMQKVPQVGALPDPEFAFGYFIKPVETRIGAQRYTFNLSQKVPWFGLLKAKKDVATQMANAAYEKFENAKSNLYFEVKTAYYNYYFIEKAIEITQSNKEILEVFKRLSLVKIETGMASLVDELRVELELNDLENQLALLEDSKKYFKTQFNNLLNRKENDSIKIPTALWQEELPLDGDKIVDSILANNHELKSIDYKLTAFVNQEKVAEKQGLPSFKIGVGYTILEKYNDVNPTGNGDDAILFPQIGVKIPLYRKKYKALIKEAQLLQESEIANKENKENMLKTIFEKTNKEYKDGNRRIDLNKKQTEIAKKVLDLLITSYSTNSKDFEEVLRIERQLLKYQLAYQKALIDKNVATAFVQYLQGK
jgi:outer membrane protein TolC